MATKLIPKRKLLKKVGLSYPTIWKLMREGSFPRAVKTTDTKICWIEAEVDSWIEALPRQRLKGDPKQ